MGETPSPVELFGGPVFMRSFPLEDLSIKSGDGRTVEAYAAVFDVQAEIMDGEGHYHEVIDRNAFNGALARAQTTSGGWRVGVFYNHGMTIHGTPSERGSVPIGTPELIRADSRGLLTVTRYNKTPQAEEILEAIRTGGITAQSFTGRIMRSDPTLSRADRRRGGYLPVNGQLQTVRRMELGLAEYGPTPMPAYADAEIVGVRTLNLLNLSDEDRAETPEESEPGTAKEAVSPLHRRLAAAMRARGI